MADDDATLHDLERGALAFAVRPRVEGQPGIQRFLVLLGAEEAAPDEERAWRRVVVGKKRLPKPGAGEREWAYVDRIEGTREALLADLGEVTYATKTRGLRHQPGARIVAEGTYRIVAHGDHVHLAYELDDPDAADEALGVCARGSVVVAVFNPLATWSRQATLAYGGAPDDDAPHREPSIYPDELQATFGDKRFTPLAPAFLAYEGAELVLMGAVDELPEERALRSPPASRAPRRDPAGA